MPWSYAVLAFLSESCPPPEGRLPTCYSPVRHFRTEGFLVRLACVRPAANVRSEPGSNSPVETFEFVILAIRFPFAEVHPKNPFARGRFAFGYRCSQSLGLFRRTDDSIEPASHFCGVSSDSVFKGRVGDSVSQRIGSLGPTRSPVKAASVVPLGRQGRAL